MDLDASTSAPPAHHDNSSLPVALIAGIIAASLLVLCVIIGVWIYVVRRRRRNQQRTRLRAAEAFVSARGRNEFTFTQHKPSDLAAFLGPGTFQKYNPIPIADYSSGYNGDVSLDYSTKRYPQPNRLSNDMMPLIIRDDMNHGFIDGIPGRLATPPPSPPRQQLPPLSIPYMPPKDSISKQLPPAPPDTFESIPLTSTTGSPTSAYSQSSASSHMRRVIEKKPLPTPPCPPIPPHFSSMLQPESRLLDRITMRPPLQSHNGALRSGKSLNRADTKHISRLLRSRIGPSPYAPSSDTSHSLEHDSDMEIAHVGSPGFPISVQSPGVGFEFR